MTQGEALSILKTGANVFLTGSPGSGKTHTITAYVAWLREHGIEPAITASTGIAATHIHGQTIHSWSGIGVAESLDPVTLDRILSKEHVVKRIQKTSVLIIDEISMLSANALSMVEEVCRLARHSERAFGGIQVVLVGDFFQLPPISRHRQTSFAFQSEAWEKVNPIICYLHEQHRQEDKHLLNTLTAIRSGVWDESDVSRVTARESDGSELEDDVPRLYTHNEDVDRLNQEKLEKLTGASRTYQMSEYGSKALIEALKRGCLSPERLVLKPGALVMCTKNSPNEGFVNGTLGKVVRFEIETGHPVIETIDGRLLTIAPHDWAVEENGKVKATITQVPLRLAWAITIHKSQGMSLDQAAVDLSRVFEYGQGYVALSRVRTLEGLFLLGWSEAAFAIHPEVSEIDRAFMRASDEAVRVFEALEETGERRQMEERFLKAVGGAKGKKAGKKDTYQETADLIATGLSIPEAAKKRKLTVGTICDHVEKLIAQNRLTVHAEDVLPPKLQKALPLIHEAFKEKGAEKLAPVHTMLRGAYSYDELRMARLTWDV